MGAPAARIVTTNRDAYEIVSDVAAPLRKSSRRNAASLLSALMLLALLAGAAVVFALRPDIDLSVARLFYTAGGGFIGPSSPLIRILHRISYAAPLVILGGLGCLYAAGRLRLIPRHLAPRGRSVVFLVLSMALGPGLFVNGILKEVSHRPRPLQLREFGGGGAFRPFYRFDGTCATNCSFPSGEAAAAFWTVAPASLAPLPLRPVAIGAAILFGVATGGLRLAYGAHFLSDVIVAALLSVLIVVALRLLLLDRRRKPIR